MPLSYKLVLAILPLTWLLLTQSWSPSWNFLFSRDSSGEWQNVLSSNPSCNISRVTAYETYTTPIHLSTGGLEPFEAPKLVPLNKTSGEQWEFDGISASAKAGIVIGFYRDPNYEILGTGNLRVSVDILFESGDMYSQDHHVSESVIEECEDFTRGTWVSKNVRYAFEVSKTLDRARVEIDTPTMKGNFTINSFTPPRYPDGETYPSAHGSSFASPYFHWVDPIPAGSMAMDMVVDGKPFVWEGIGGHFHMWSAFSWFTVLEGLQIVRAVIGPYSLTYLASKSHFPDPGVTYHSVFLVEQGRKIFSATLGHVSETEDYVTLSNMYGSGATGTLADKSTGCVLNLVSPARGKHWHFEFIHNSLFFEFALGQGTGGSGFASIARGGDIEGGQYTGVAMREQLSFPENSPFFKSNYA